MICTHTPACPSADDPARDAAKIVHEHHSQGWVLLCNGIITFDDTGALIPPTADHSECISVAPHRPNGPRRLVCASA